jgi:hypothetical protein
MAYITTNGNGNSIHGRRLAHRKMSHWLRLHLAADAATCACRYIPTDKEIAAAFRVSPSSLCEELKARAERGVKRNGDGAAIAAIIDGWNAASEPALDEAVRRIGLARVWDVLDRLTK